MVHVHVHSTDTLRTEVTNGRHQTAADEPLELGGTDTALEPKELLAASLGTCTAITVQMYAKRKAWPLEAVKVRVEVVPPESKAGDQTTRIRQEVSFEGPLDDEQRERLLAISGRCPVHRILDGPIEIEEVAV